MKLGIDIHGTLDHNPQLFLDLIKGSNWEEIHIITGVPITDKVIEELLGYNDGIQFWDTLVSIEDNLKKTSKPLGINEKGRYIWDEDLWDSFKGSYCFNNGIDIHFDDTPRYGQYFNNFVTKFVLYNYK